MVRVSSKQLKQSFWAKLLGFLCVALILMSGVVQVAHSHPSGQPDHDCALCLSAHQTVHTVAPVTLHVSSRPVAVLAADPVPSLPVVRYFYRLACRPPPADPAFA
jgi:hypothetical protein